MCLANTLWWSSGRDIEYQTVPVNDANNDQGNPGQEGGYYDAGFDENHMNVGDDYFTLTVARSGTDPLVNPGFDSDLSGWHVNDPTVWDPRDVEGLSGASEPGSVHLDNVYFHSEEVFHDRFEVSF